MPDLDALPGPYPKWVSVKLPEDATEQSTVRGEMLGAGRMLSTLSERYVPFDVGQVDESEAQPMDEITDRDRDAKALPKWVDRHGGSPEDYRFYRFGARYEYCYVGFDTITRRFVGVLETPAPR